MTGEVVYIVAVEGLERTVQGLGAGLTASVEKNSVRAVNTVARLGRTLASRKIREQVNFSASYLNSESRLVVSKTARRGDVEGIIRGRARPTSLARFTKDRPLAPGQRTQRRGKGVRVNVKPGVARYMRSAFVIPLRSGQDGSTNNLGLAVRSENKPGGAYKPKLIGKNLWLLYGPSVSQILYSARTDDGVAQQITPELADKLEAEFVRLMNLDLP